MGVVFFLSDVWRKSEFSKEGFWPVQCMKTFEGGQLFLLLLLFTLDCGCWSLWLIRMLSFSKKFCGLELVSFFRNVRCRGNGWMTFTSSLLLFPIPPPHPTTTGNVLGCAQTIWRSDFRFQQRLTLQRKKLVLDNGSVVEILPLCAVQVEFFIPQKQDIYLSLSTFFLLCPSENLDY